MDTEEQDMGLQVKRNLVSKINHIAIFTNLLYTPYNYYGTVRI